MKNIVVVGAGVIGLMCAYELRKYNEHVALIDKGDPGKACSWGNAGWIVPSLSAPLPAPGLTITALKWMMRRDSPFYIDPKALPHMTGWLWNFWRHCDEKSNTKGKEALRSFNRFTMPLYDSLEADGIDCEMERAGLLFLFLTESAMYKHLEEIVSPDDVSPPNPLSGEELRRIEPAVSKQVVAGFFVKGERHLRPESLNTGLLNWLLREQVKVYTKTCVMGGDRQGRILKAVHTTYGSITGDQFVIAAGAWSGLVAEKLGFRIPIQAGKGYSITISHPHSQLHIPLYLGETRVGCTPFKHSLRLAGTLELSGINSRVSDERLAALAVASTKYLNFPPRVEAQSGWMGMRPLTPDGLPVIGHAPGFDNVFVATGHGMLGMTLAAATGTAIRELICCGHTRFELGAFDPARFG
jgi:D-amino-acid dehydrogenase